MGGKRGLFSNPGAAISDGLGGLFGKKPKTPNGFTPLDPLQEKAMAKFGQLLDTDTDQLARNSVVKQEEMIRSGAKDAERMASQLVAQRGLGNSSVGLNSIINSTRDIGDKIGAVRASLPGLMHDYRGTNLASTSRGINEILNSRNYIQAPAREGGLLQALAPAAGSLAGQYMGKKN